MKFRVRPLYAVTATMGISAALFTLANLREGPDPLPPDAMEHFGFTSQEQVNRISTLLETRRIMDLSDSDVEMLKKTLKSDTGSRNFAIGVIQNLASEDLQNLFLNDVEELLKSNGDSSLVRSILPYWLKRDGKAIVQTLANNGDPRVREPAKKALETYEKQNANSKKAS